MAREESVWDMGHICSLKVVLFAATSVAQGRQGVAKIQNEKCAELLFVVPLSLHLQPTATIPAPLHREPIAPVKADARLSGDPIKRTIHGV